MSDERRCTLAYAVGRRLRELRDAAGVTAENVAAAARDLGMSWHRSTVASLETGERGLSLGEALALPLVCRSAGIGEVTFAALLPNGDSSDLVELAGELSVRARSTRMLLDEPEHIRLGDLVTPGLRDAQRRLADPAFWQRTRARAAVLEAAWPEATGSDSMKARDDADGEAERKLARKYGVPALAVALAARAVWGRGLTDERDARVADRVDGDASARTVQAVRGHVTRALAGELHDRLTAAAVAGGDS